MLTQWQIVMAVVAVAATVTTATTTATTTAVTATPPGSPKPISKSWFREKYIQQINDDYYEYTLTRYELGDNDRDVCPDIYKSSIIFAITGQHIYRITKTCSALYVNIETAKSDDDDDDDDDQAIQYITGIITSIIEFIGKFMCYTFEMSMLILSIILACCTTIFMIILLFCQY